ncbi:hypothetical protein H8959_008269 [Pygathrix nigripes]
MSADNPDLEFEGSPPEKRFRFPKLEDPLLSGTHRGGIVSPESQGQTCELERAGEPRSLEPATKTAEKRRRTVEVKVTGLSSSLLQAHGRGSRQRADGAQSHVLGRLVVQGTPAVSALWAPASGALQMKLKTPIITRQAPAAAAVLPSEPACTPAPLRGRALQLHSPRCAGQSPLHLACPTHGDFAPFACTDCKGEPTALHRSRLGSPLPCGKEAAQLFPSFPLHPVPVQALSQGRKKRNALSSPSLAPSPASGSPRCRAPAGARPGEWVSQPQRLELGEREQGHPCRRAGTPLFRLPAGQVRVPARGARVSGGAGARGSTGSSVVAGAAFLVPGACSVPVPVSLIETRLREGVDRGKLRARRGWGRGRGPGEAPEGSAGHRRAALLGDCYFERQRPPPRGSGCRVKCHFLRKFQYSCNVSQWTNSLRGAV